MVRKDNLGRHDWIIKAMALGWVGQYQKSNSTLNNVLNHLRLYDFASARVGSSNTQKGYQDDCVRDALGEQRNDDFDETINVGLMDGNTDSENTLYFARFLPDHA